ncbi:hypothetical protein FOA52_015938 [Chlamydomonas sp. UWO 241]|nr:hypothetical protein FOA52_015938 [Chlamydomonas sp. UWO 241]
MKAATIISFRSAAIISVPRLLVNLAGRLWSTLAASPHNGHAKGCLQQATSREMAPRYEGRELCVPAGAARQLIRLIAGCETSSKLLNVVVKLTSSRLAQAMDAASAELDRAGGLGSLASCSVSGPRQAIPQHGASNQPGGYTLGSTALP